MRNTACPHYMACLQKAISASQGTHCTFKCDGCTHQHAKSEIDDLWPCFLLLTAICKPDLFEKYKADLTERLSSGRINEILKDLDDHEPDPKILLTDS